MAIINGTAGDDNFTATPGDTIDGGAGNDTLTIDFSTFPQTPDYLTFYFANASQVYARMRKSDGSDDHTVIYFNFSNIENINISGTPNQDSMSAWSSGNVTLHGAGGTDFLYVSGTGTYVVDGGDGQDFVDFSGAPITSGVTVDLGITSAQQAAVGLGAITLTSVEGVFGTVRDDRIVAGAGNAYFRGYAGNDVMIGGAGDDQLEGYEGNDTLSGGDGTDSLWGGSGTDTLEGGGGRDALNGEAGDDTLRGGDGDDFFWGEAGNDIIDGGAGFDSLNYRNNTTENLVVDLTLGSATSASFGSDTLIGIESVATGVGNDRIIGNVAANVLWGWEGDDIIIGAAGNDELWGGTGNDTLQGDAGDDELDGVDGLDTASYQNAAGGVTVSLAIASAQAVGGGEGTDALISIENLTGSSYDDTLTGSSADNTLTGLAGNDRISSGDGLDTLNGGAGNDTLDGGLNVDTAVFAGNSWAYTITQGTTGTFTVTGSDGADTLTNVEYARFDDKTVRLLPGTGMTVNFSADPSTYMGAIRDFDGNNLGGASSWKLIGTADVNGDGRAEHILFNRAIGRWAEVGTQADGNTYFANNGWAGDTRVVGIYIDPLVANGTVVKNSDTDSQRRFQNDLTIDNIKSILGQGDYNKDGLQEIYFSLTDGTAYLHAYMHADGNIQYANYQNKQQVIDYLTANGVASSTWAGWFPASQMSMLSAPGG